MLYSLSFASHDFNQFLFMNQKNNEQGIKKEARWLCENMMCDGFDSGFSTMIRGCAFELLSWKQDEYTSDGDVDVAVDMVCSKEMILICTHIN